MRSRLRSTKHRHRPGAYPGCFSPRLALNHAVLMKKRCSQKRATLSSNLNLTHQEPTTTRLRSKHQSKITAGCFVSNRRASLRSDLGVGIAVEHLGQDAIRVLTQPLRLRYVLPFRHIAYALMGTPMTKLDNSAFHDPTINCPTARAFPYEAAGSSKHTRAFPYC